MQKHGSFLASSLCAYPNIAEHNMDEHNN